MVNIYCPTFHWLSSLPRCWKTENACRTGLECSLKQGYVGNVSLKFPDSCSRMPLKWPAQTWPRDKRKFQYSINKSLPGQLSFNLCLSSIVSLSTSWANSLYLVLSNHCTLQCFYYLTIHTPVLVVCLGATFGFSVLPRAILTCRRIKYQMTNTTINWLSTLSHKLWSTLKYFSITWYIRLFVCHLYVLHAHIC